MEEFDLSTSAYVYPAYPAYLPVEPWRPVPSKQAPLVQEGVGQMLGSMKAAALYGVQLLDREGTSGREYEVNAARPTPEEAERLRNVLAARVAGPELPPEMARVRRQAERGALRAQNARDRMEAAAPPTDALAQARATVRAAGRRRRV